MPLRDTSLSMAAHLELGKSVEGRVIEALVWPCPGRPAVVVLGGVHGDEPKGVYVARKLMALLEADPEVGGERAWVIVPVVNPDGYERRKRRNAHGVDINRNFPTTNWLRTSPRGRMFGGNVPAGEPETRAVIELVERYAPRRIITIHSIGRGRYCNNYDGPGRALAKRMRRHNGYPVTGSIGYPTPGSLGYWAGMERSIATITLELPSHHSPKRCWQDNQRALLEACRK